MADKYATINDVENIVNKAVDELSVVISGFAQDVSDRFDANDKRFDDIDQQLKQLTVEQRSMASQLNSMQQAITDLQNRIDRVESKLKAINNDLGELYASTMAVTESIAEIKRMKTELDKLWAWAEKVSKQTGIKLPNAKLG